MGTLDSFSERPLSSRVALINMGLDVVGIVVSLVLFLQFGVSLVLGILVTIIASTVVAGGYFLVNR
ncbi:MULTISPECIES: hypothetical protein [Halococcus]|uniref:hypothetical protein n=1 Tax=Halococcus TaxID=2249 RepID=UPI000E7140C7|nr:MULTISPECIES: hypothetical protein [Halococcus]RJS97755.1 hypothetical protein D3261_17690 [Halococcus sp. IIIV-5B]